MKKYLYMIIAAAALMAVGCEKNIEMVSEDDVNQDLLSLTIELPTDTKIAFNGNDGYKSSWEEGDVLAVQTSEPTGDSPAKYDLYELKEGAGTKKGTFKGTVTPLQGGKVLYPAKGWDTSSETLNGNGPAYHFNNEYVWDEDANKENKIHSVVPMAGKVSGTTITDFDYVAGAVSITYSKIPLTTAKFIVTLTGPNLTGFAYLNNSGTKLSAPTSEDTKGNTITIYMNSDKETQLGGTAYNAQFFFPVPAETYTGLTMELEREDGITIGGSKYSMAKGKTLEVKNKELKKLPTIVPIFPEFYFTLVATGETLSDGEYILVYDRGNGKAWVNGDDDLREVLPADIITIEEMAFIDSKYWGKTGIKLDLADYETGAWKMTYHSSTGTWDAQTAGKGIFDIKDGGWTNDGYINMAYLMDGEEYTHDSYYKNYYAWCKWIRYVGPNELDRTGDSQWADPKFDNGVFLIPDPHGGWTYTDNPSTNNPNFNSATVVQASNLKIFRLIGKNEL